MRAYRIVDSIIFYEEPSPVTHKVVRFLISPKNNKIKIEVNKIMNQP